MSTPTLLVGYYYGLLLRDIDGDQLWDKMSTSGLLTAHHQHLISAGYSVHQKKHLLLEVVRQMDDKSFVMFCGVLLELWPDIGTQFNTGKCAWMVQYFKWRSIHCRYSKMAPIPLNLVVPYIYSVTTCIKSLSTTTACVCVFQLNLYWWIHGLFSTTILLVSVKLFDS